MLRINSNFKDFYDEAALKYNDNELEYNRMRGDSDDPTKDSMSRREALEKCRGLGFHTIQIEKLSEIADKVVDTELLVVYIDEYRHSMNGKRVMSAGEAKEMYKDAYVSRYVAEKKNYKYIQIGRKAFLCEFEKESRTTLDHGKLLRVAVLNDRIDFNFGVRLPIFSVDYVIDDGKPLLTDFNTVEELGKYKIDKYITPEEVVREIVMALEEYN
jgi:hypothetical protein